MRAFILWKSTLTWDFLELKRLSKQKPFPHVRYDLKEQEIGQHCCQAGENLVDLELASLKQALGLDEQLWQTYKRKVRPRPEEPYE